MIKDKVREEDQIELACIRTGGRQRLIRSRYRYPVAARRGPDQRKIPTRTPERARHRAAGAGRSGLRCRLNCRGAPCPDNP
jgi:hypothetical protein